MPSVLHTVSFRVPFSLYTVDFRIPSALSFLRPVVSLRFYPAVSHLEQWLTAHYIPSLIIYDPYLLSLSVAPYSIFPSSFLNWRIMEYISVSGYVFFFFFLIRREDYLWDSSSCRTFNDLDTWRGPIGCASDEALLRLPRPFIPYIMGALLLIFPISFLADLWERDRRLLHCCPWSRFSKKDNLLVSSISFFFFLIFCL